MDNSYSSNAISYTFQRHVFFEPKAGNFWAFYYDGQHIRYKYSPDGSAWLPKNAYSMPSWWPSLPNGNFSLPGMFASGQTVILAAGSQYPDTNLSTGVFIPNATISPIIGIINGQSISWQAMNTIYLNPFNLPPCAPLPGCTVSIGIRNVNVALIPNSAGGSDPAFSVNWYYNNVPQNAPCATSLTQSNYHSNSEIFLVYKNKITLFGSPTTLNLPNECNRWDLTDHFRSVILSTGTSSGPRVIFQQPEHSGHNDCQNKFVVSDSTELCSATFDSNGNLLGTTEIIDQNVANDPEFSAVSDANYGAHIVYRTPDGTVSYTYRAWNGAWITPTRNIITISGGPIRFPTITVDYSTNDLYVFAMDGLFVLMRTKTLAQNWADRSVVLLYFAKSGAASLGSTLAATSSSTSYEISVIWTQPDSSQAACYGTSYQNQCDIMHIAFPINLVWSPFSTPSDPWDGSGIVPNGEYVNNLGEQVSPSSGMLTVHQTDLTMPGRGLDLDITRVYVEPYYFYSGDPYNYETYPWAPMGIGWQLNFPWLKNTTTPRILHLWNGQGYIIPSSFWTGPTASWDNHVATHFTMTRKADATITMYTNNGGSYLFDSSHRLQYITDRTGNNTITINYDPTYNRISNICDSAQRKFLFSYNGVLLQTISQSSGSCANPGSTVRSLVYGYTGSALTSVTDPGGRTTSYQYTTFDCCSLHAPWLISKITYPNQWYTTYTYTPKQFGTRDFTVAFQVASQSLNSQSGQVRAYQYAYIPGLADRVASSTVAAYDGAQIASYTDYAFSYAGLVKNISDASHLLVRGVQYLFDTRGDVVKETVLVTDGSGRLGSYTNYYGYDLWGNQIYSRKTINPSINLYHESFNAYYNDGLPPGFNAFQDTFNQNQGSTPDNSWNVTNGYWMVKPGIAFEDNNFTSGWSEEVSNVAGQSKTASGDTVQLSASFTSGTPGYYRTVKTIGTPVNGTTYPTLTVRLKGSINKSLLRVELRDGSTYFDPSNGSGDVWKTSTGWTVAVLNVGGRNSINLIKLGITSEWDTSISGTQTGTFDYAFLADEIPSSKFDTLGQYYGSQTSGQQEANFAWVDIGKADVSVQAKVFITNRMNASDQRVGIFVHHSTNNYKWILVLHNRPDGSGMFLELTDESYGGWPPPGDPGMTSCPLNYGAWYTFNMTVHGLSATGWAIAPGWSSPCTVSRTFSVQSPAYAGTGFGLYSGGYAARFDNVTATTVSPFITPTGFSNSFIQNGAPGPIVHGAIAGRGELANSTGAAPASETYFGYTQWGGLAQEKKRYDPVNLAVDGSAQAFCGNSTTSCAATLSTSYGNDILIAYAFEALDLRTSCTFSISDTAGLSWTNRGGILFANNNRDQLQEFWAKSTGTLSYDTITESISGCVSAQYGGEYNGLQVFATSGANFNNPFDPNPSLPGANAGNSARPSLPISTTNGNDIVISAVQQAYQPVLTAGSGFTMVIWTGGWSAATEYELANSRLTNFPVTFSASAAGPNEQIVDALQPAVGPPQWLTSTRQYDMYGSPKNYTDFMGNQTRYAFSSTYNNAYLTNQTSILTGPPATTVTTSYAYNFTTGNIVSVTDPVKNVTSYRNDNLGRTTRITYPTQDYISYSYNDKANYVNITDENNKVTRQIYDGLARLTVIDRFQNGRSYSNQTYTYNWMGEVVTQTDPLGHRYTYQYDVLGRLVVTTKPDGNSTLRTYNDYNGWVLLIDENGNNRCNVYDRLSRLVDVIESATSNCQPGTTTTYSYDELGELVKTTNARNRVTAYAYDNLDRLFSTTNPDGTLATYSYDRNGNVIQEIDPKSVKSTYSYDSLNRVKSIAFSGSPNTSNIYNYDLNGNLLTLQIQNSTLSYRYDSRNRVISETYRVNGGSLLGSTYTVGYVYSGEFLSRLNYPDGRWFQYAYDSLGRVLSVSESNQTSYAMLAYDRGDHIGNVTFGSGLLAKYQYDSLARPTSMTLSIGQQSPLSLTYAYTKTGTVSKITGQVNGTSVNEQYSYDTLQRLTNSTVTSGGATSNILYTYDSLGNRQSQNVNNILTTFSYSQANSELQTSNGSGQIWYYSYDANGNLAGLNVPGVSSWTYTWDAPGNLVKVSNNAVVQGSYAYDGLGRRIESIEGSTTTFYAYLGTETLYEFWFSGSSNGANDYVYAGGLRIARAFSGTTYYYHTDALGGTRLVTSPSHRVIFCDNYQPFGQNNGTPGGSETYKFTGKPYSSATGLYYEYQRWYDASTGRFISQDPLRGYRRQPQSLNPYVYVTNQPTLLTDPTGMVLDCPTDSSDCSGGGSGGSNNPIPGSETPTNPMSPTDVPSTSLTPDTSISNGVGTQEDITNVGKFLNDAEGNSPRARLARNADFGRGVEEYVAETQGEKLNRGPGQIQVQNELGTYKPDTLGGSEIKGVEYQSLDEQMRIAIRNAQITQRPFTLYILEDYTALSRPLQRLVDVWIRVVGVKLPA